MSGAVNWALYRLDGPRHSAVMAILKIARMGHPVLRKPALPVTDPGGPEVRRLVEDMLETMVDAEGTGLAAPQVYVPLRIVIFFVTRERTAEEDNSAGQEEGIGDGSLAVPLTILVNPQWEPLSEEVETGPEACLSVPGLLGQVPRYRRIRYGGLTPQGDEVLREAEGFHARVVQHECDHLDGVLYPQRMRDATSLIFASEAGARFSEKDALRRFGHGE